MISIGQNLKVADNYLSFIDLLDRTVVLISGRKEKLLAMQGDFWRNFELITFEALKEVQRLNSNALFSKWEIELISGGKFPDIVLTLLKNQKFGIEVKTTKSKNWKTLGGSIMETTKVEGVNRIHVFFAKQDPFEIRHRNFEDCVSDVAVTHSPRYVIDLDIKKEDSIFFKINKSYDEIRNSSNPYQYFKEYFKSKADEKGNGLWFINSEDNIKVEDLSSLEIKFYSSLSMKEKNYLKAKMLILFPEILYGGNDKYKKAILWLFTRGIVNSSFRDVYSAAGKKVIFNQSVPHIYFILYSMAKDISNIFLDEFSSIEFYEIFKQRDLKKCKNIWKAEIIQKSNPNYHETLKSILNEI